MSPRPSNQPSPTLAGMRLDKWMWAARLYKTRALAAEDIDRGRVSVNTQVAKASRELRVGDVLTLRQSGLEREFQVLGLSMQRGPASVAQTLYAETAASQARRSAWLETRRQGVEPALSHEQGRPTKRDRRQLADWQRWSASADSLRESLGDRPGGGLGEAAATQRREKP